MDGIVSTAFEQSNSRVCYESGAGFKPCKSRKQESFESASRLFFTFFLASSEPRFRNRPGDETEREQQGQQQQGPRLMHRPQPDGHLREQG